MDIYPFTFEPLSDTPSNMIIIVISSYVSFPQSEVKPAVDRFIITVPHRAAGTPIHQY